ncbi:MAG: 16S rRNA (guanine(527)-N(7))-methyltransferase RsmG [Bacteroidetes bacterium]|nr:16S rRNA (guanine(527)-N(7))-methyltransferase RsmG [Bacteroidota bacterium]
MTIDELAHITAANGLELSDNQRAKLERYGALLREANAVVNLISRKDEENILSKHILHSLTLAMPSVIGFAIPPNATVFDIGTGGGLPGIPLKIVRDDLRMVLCDSIGKKIAAVEKIVNQLALADVNAIAQRSEVLAQNEQHRRAYDVVVSRAVAPLDELMKWTADLLKPGGTLLSLKGGDLTEEITRTKRLKGVASIAERALALVGYEDFVTEEKKVVIVRTVG